jgi:hypothetical protein
MAIVIPRLPDLGSAQEVEAFWRANQELMHGVILSASMGYLTAPAAFAGANILVAVAVIIWDTRALPRWLGSLAIVGILTNVGVVLGTLSLTGPAQLR